MPDSLYERDILLWSEQQADLLRRVASGERVASVDWPNVIEEILDPGRSGLHGCQSLLEQAMVHLLKLHGQTGSRSRNHWRVKVLAFLAGARRYMPSMEQRIGLRSLYADALRQAGAALADLPEQPVWQARLMPADRRRLTLLMWGRVSLTTSSTHPHCGLALKKLWWWRNTVLGSCRKQEPLCGS